MRYLTAFAIAIAVISFATIQGCSTTGGSSGGWVVADRTTKPPPTQHRPATAPEVKRGNQGQLIAARNHLRSAYRFLQKGKPEHAMRELEKARDKMGASYWFHYYMGGAYFLKGMYQRAEGSWDTALGYAGDGRMGSRLRTCQSFAVNYLRGDEPSIGLLKMALDLDRDNHQARELLEDLHSSGQVAGAQIGFMHPSERSEDKGVNGGNVESKGKKGREKGKSKKSRDKTGKIRDKELFRAYFLVEMP
jgi:tetratricopeptide (TPR) repeat protein